MKAEELGNAILRVVNAVGAVVAAILALVLVLEGAKSQQQPIIITTGGGQVVDVPADEEVISRGSGYNTPCYFEQGGAVLSADSGCSIRIESGASITTANGATFTADNLSAAYITATTGLQAQAATITGAVSSYAVTATASLSTPLLYVEGIAQSGPVRFGSATAATTGTLIAHGLGTTPTAVILTLSNPIDTLTNTIGAGPTNATSFTVYIPGGATVDLNWMAGR